MLSDNELMTVQATSDQITGEVTIIANPTDPSDPFEANLFNVARQISGVSMNRIRLEEGDGNIFPGKASLTLSDGKVSNIHYLAAPEGRELSPFLDAVLWLGSGVEPLKAEVADSLLRVTDPVHVLVLMAEACPHCPETVRSAAALAVRRPFITVSVVDAIRYGDMADRFKVKSTPTVIMNDGLTLVGRISADELAGHLLSIAAADSTLTPVLDSMVKSGRAEDAGLLLCSENQPEAILPILMSQEFSVRMGALVAMEEALIHDPRVFDPIIEQLTSLLSQDEAGLRGDTADLLGKIGNPAAIPALQKVAAEDPDPDVREAAQEALELIES